jgi:hypothetical protein
VFLLFNDLASSQSKFEISGGGGFPDLMTLKKKNTKNIQTAIGQSFLVGTGEGFVMIAFTGEIYYHFAGRTRFIEQRPWYLLGGLGILYSLDGTYLYLRAGRVINFSKRTGINLDAGTVIPLFKNDPPVYPFYENDSPIYPSISISFFMRY